MLLPLWNVLLGLFLALLGLCSCVRAFSRCGEQRLLFVVVRRRLIVVASLVAEHGLRNMASGVVAHGFSCPMACGIFLDQGLNPYPLHWQADS